MATARRAPYCWVTWATKLLAGESHCLWSGWFRAHYAYDKVPSDFDFAAWNVEHAALSRDRTQELRVAGYTVRVEDQNSFKLVGKNGLTLAGKPDILGRKGDDILIVDAKTGKVRDSDHAQVSIYLSIAPIIWPQYLGLKLAGEICYPKQRLPVSPPDEGFRKTLRQLMDQIAGTTQPARVPGCSECKWCDIGPGDCPERVVAEAAATAADHDLF